MHPYELSGQNKMVQNLHFGYIFLLFLFISIQSIDSAIYFHSLSKILLGTFTKRWGIKNNEFGSCNQRVLSFLWKSVSKEWDESYSRC